MATKDINIKIALIDNFTSAATRVQASTIKIGESLEQTGRHISQFGGKLALIGGATSGSLLLAMNGIKDASPALTKTFGELDNVMRNLQLSIGNSVQPALQSLVDIFAALTDAWNALDPKMRDSILQFAFLGGVALTAVGAFMKVTGAIISVVGRIVTLVKYLSWTNIAIGAVVTGIALMVQHWEKVKSIVLPIVNGLAIGVDLIALAFLQMADVILMAFDKLASLLPKRFQGVRDSIDGARQALAKFQTKVGDDLVRAVTTGTSAATDAVDKMATGAQTQTQNLSISFKTLWDNFQKNAQSGTSRAKQYVNDWAAVASNTVKRVADAMSQSLGNFFYNVLTRQITSAKQAFAEFGQSVLRILTDVIARLILQLTLQKAIQSAFGMPSFSFFHSGGQVKRAHSGTLAQDEVPIIAQEGEGILTRQGMGRLGANNLKSLNRGESMDGGGGGSGPVVVIQAWDTRDIQRNSKAIEELIANAMRRNGSLRGVMKRYA